MATEDKFDNNPGGFWDIITRGYEDDRGRLSWPVSLPTPQPGEPEVIGQRPDIAEVEIEARFPGTLRIEVPNTRFHLRFCGGDSLCTGWWGNIESANQHAFERATYRGRRQRVSFDNIITGLMIEDAR